MGIGFAIPSNLARKVVDDLKQYGEVRRGSVGFLRVEQLTEQSAQEFGAPNTRGALVSRMTRDSKPLKPACVLDVIVDFNGRD